MYFFQESKNNITQYLTPCNIPKNKNDYIPGTNIRKDSIRTDATSCQTDPNKQSSSSDDVDKSFLDDDEDDALLANLDL